MSHRQWAEITDRERLDHSPTVILLLVQDLTEGGWFVRGHDRTGRETIETWHGSAVAAREWAATEYGSDRIGGWLDIPDDTADAIRYALRRRR